MNTTSKTITGAINEINSSLTASDNTKFEFTKSGDSYGYKNNSGTFVPFKTVQASKTVTAGTSAITVTPDSGNDGIASVTVNPTPSQTKSATPSTSAQTISPDSGKLLSSVPISAISPQNTNGSDATASGIENGKPWVAFPYGWWPKNNNDRSNVYMTAAQAVAACPSQTKTITSSRSAQTVTPDSGKLLSSVTVNKYPDASGTYGTITSNGTHDMGSTNNYRYVSVAVNQTPSYSSYSPTGKLEYHNGGTSSTNTGGCYVELGTPSVSKSGSTITVTIPETLWPYGGYGKWTAPNNTVYRSIVVNLTI